MTHQPKEKIQDSSLGCTGHEDSELIFYCSKCNVYGCLSCYKDHFDHEVK